MGGDLTTPSGGSILELHPGLTEARFVTRVNRFAATVVCEGREVLAHVPNSGRMTELLRGGATVFLTPAPVVSGRKTQYDLTLVEYAGELVSVDSRLPTALIHEAMESGSLAEFAGYPQTRREVVLDDSRIDLLLSGPRGHCYVETKSVNLVEAGTALFPDAPTERGRKHLGSLMGAVREGHRACVAFVIQRADATKLSPHRAADPLFCDTLKDVIERGVEAYAYRCIVSMKEIAIRDSVPITLT